MPATTTTTTTSNSTNTSSQSPLPPLPPKHSQPTYTWTLGPLALLPTPRASNRTATDQYTLIASEMALVHNIIIRSLNSIYLQAPHVPPSHQSAFTCYMLATWQTVHEHHRGEETSLFPAIEKATGETGIMEVNVRQHQAFETGFEAWGHWIRDVEQERERFSGQRCRDLMDGFMRDLATHLAEEIPSLMALAKYPESRLPLRRLWEEEGKAVMGGLSKTRQLPVVLLNHDVTFEGEGLHANFPPLPAPVKWVLMNVCARWNASWWAFSTCGVDGRPRELAFLGE